MAHGERAATKRAKSKDYWSPRPCSCKGGCTRCPYMKKLTHRLERRKAKHITKEIE